MIKYFVWILSLSVGGKCKVMSTPLQCFDHCCRTLQCSCDTLLLVWHRPCAPLADYHYVMHNNHLVLYIDWSNCSSHNSVSDEYCSTCNSVRFVCAHNSVVTPLQCSDPLLPFHYDAHVTPCSPCLAQSLCIPLAIIIWVTIVLRPVSLSDWARSLTGDFQCLSAHTHSHKCSHVYSARIKLVKWLISLINV